MFSVGRPDARDAETLTPNVMDNEILIHVAKAVNIKKLGLFNFRLTARVLQIYNTAGRAKEIGALIESLSILSETSEFPNAWARMRKEGYSNLYCELD